REPFAAARRAAAVPRLVGGNAEEPGPQRLARPEAAKRAPRLDERVLNGVLGVCSVACDHVRHSESDLLVGTNELLVCARIAALRSQHELPLVVWTALHACNYTANGVGVPDLR